MFNEFFRKLAVMSAGWLGSPWVFVANVLLILVWLGSGPFFNYSDTWQLIVNTATTVITYLAVFLIQNTQNRDAKAMHLKLDELISNVEGARNRMVYIEKLSDEELERLEPEFQELYKRAEKNHEDSVRAINLDEISSAVAEAVETNDKTDGKDKDQEKG